MEINNRRGNIILAIIVASYLMLVLDVSIVITALPKLKTSLNFSDTGLSWVQNAYTLTFGGFLLLGARAGDILGRRRMYILGQSIFILASLAIVIAQSAEWMLISRAVQGIGAAILAPSTLSLLATNFPEGTARTRAMAYYASAAGMGASIGLVVGGLLADLISWRVGFFINLPIGIALIIGAKRFLNETELHSGQFDIIGAFSSTLGMTALVYSIVRSASVGWTDHITLFTLALGLILLTGFVLNEKYASQPIMPLHLFANAERTGAYIARLLYLGGMVGFWFFMTQYFQGVLNFSSSEAGMAFLPTTIVNFLVGISVPKLAKRFSNSFLLTAGLIMTMLGMAWLSYVCAEQFAFWFLSLPMVLIGAGQGMVLAPLTVSGVKGVTHEDAGAASGIINTAHQLGSSLGLGVLVVVFATANSEQSDLITLMAHRISYTLAFGSAVLALTLLIVITLIIQPFKQKTLNFGAITKQLD